MGNYGPSLSETGAKQTNWLVKISGKIMLGIVVLIVPSVAKAGTCEEEIRKQALDRGVPLHVAIAIARAESGDVPNAYALNVAGKPFQLRTATAAGYVIDAAVRANKHVDIGCMQINAKYHGHRVRDLRELLEPRTNVKVALDFLLELKREVGTWEAAAGAYHTRGDAARQQAYRCRLALKIDPTLDVPWCRQGAQSRKLS